MEVRHSPATVTSASTCRRRLEVRSPGPWSCSSLREKGQAPTVRPPRTPTPSPTSRKGPSIPRAVPRVLARGRLHPRPGRMHPGSDPSLTAGAPETQAAASGSPAPFPVTLVDDEGTSVTIRVQPQRIVSLSPANTETVFALGAGDRLVGWHGLRRLSRPRPRPCRTSPRSRACVMEKLVAADPDLVLAAGNGLNPARGHRPHPRPRHPRRRALPGGRAGRPGTTSSSSVRPSARQRQPRR